MTYYDPFDLEITKLQKLKWTSLSVRILPFDWKWTAQHCENMGDGPNWEMIHVGPIEITVEWARFWRDE